MDTEESNRGMDEMDQSSKQLLANLEECAESCQVGLMHSIDEGGDFVKMEHLRWMMDCHEICRLAINFFIRDSEYAGDILSLCAYICEDCSQSCKKFFNDAHMLACSEVCDNCAKACRDMIEEECEECEIRTENEKDRSDR